MGLWSQVSPPTPRMAPLPTSRLVRSRGATSRKMFSLTYGGSSIGRLSASPGEKEI